MRQNEFDGLCGSERGWSFERVLNARIDGFDDKTLDGVDDRAECATKWYEVAIYPKILDYTFLLGLNILLRIVRIFN